MIQEPSGHLRHSGLFHGASGGDIREGEVPTMGQALTWCQVAGVGLKKRRLSVTDDAAQAQLGINEHLTDEIRTV